MKNGIITVLAGAVMAVLATTVSAAEPTQVERVQAAIDAWLAARAPIEKVTGIAAYIKEVQSLLQKYRGELVRQSCLLDQGDPA